MPAVVEQPLAPPAAAAPARRRSVFPWIGLIVVVAMCAAGIWAYENQSFFSDDVPPPLPTVAPEVPTVAPSPTPLDVPTIEAPERPSVPHHAATGPARQPTPLPSTPGSEQRQTPAYPFPPFPLPLPSALPIPSGLIPSALPPFLQNIPGFPDLSKPAAPSASGSAP
jgi:hypothetical protein